MTLPGGGADKLGNRYEALWTVFQLVRLMDEQDMAITVQAVPTGSTDGSIHFEPLGIEGQKAEFVVEHTDGTRSHHQVKLRGEERWTLARLEKEGVLSAFHAKLAAPEVTCVFVSNQNADDLENLSNRARLTSSHEDFLSATLSQDLRKAWTQLRALPGWRDDEPEETWQRLRRIFVYVQGLGTLHDAVHLAVRGRIDGPVGPAVDALAGLAVKFIHQTLTAHDVWTELARDGFRRSAWQNDPRLAVLAAEVTQRYLAAVTRPAWGWYERPGEGGRELLGALGNDGPTAVLSGTAGIGKSAVAADVAREAVARGLPVLAFRLDRIDEVHTAKALGEALGLPESPVEVLSRVARGRDALLVVDQLDAVSRASGRHPNVFDVVDEMLRQAQAWPNLRVLLACRRFDLEFDDRFQKLIHGPRPRARQIDVPPLPPAAVRTLLSDAGVTVSALAPHQLKMLEVPEHLVLFFEGSDGTREPLGHGFQTVADLYERFWRHKEARIQARLPSFSLAAALAPIVARMNERMVLSLPATVLDQVGAAGPSLVSENVLTRDGARVAFAHEGLFDYAFARQFTAEGRSLLDLLRSGEQHLFRRAQVRQVLGLLRDSDPAEYARTLGDVLYASDVRYHIKQLVYDIVGSQSDPSADEWEVVSEALTGDDARLARETRLLARRSANWLRYFRHHGLLQAWFESSDPGAQADAVFSLASAYHAAPDDVLDFLEPYIASGVVPIDRITLVLRHESPPDHRRSFGFFLQLLQVDAFPPAEAWQHLDRWAEVRPDWASEGIAQLLSWGMARSPTESNKPVMSRYESSVLGGDWAATNAVARVADAAPEAFVAHVLGPMLDLAHALKSDTGGEVWKDDIWTVRWDDGNPRELPTALLDATVRALESIPEDTFRSVAERLDASDLEVAQYLLMRAYPAHAAQCADQAIAFLCGVPGRFLTAASGSGEWSARALLAAVTPFASPAALTRLEQVILDYTPDWERNPGARRQRGIGQLTLLDGIVQERRSARVMRRIGELQRKLPHADLEGRMMKVRGGSVISPLPATARARMTDEQWVQAMRRYDREDDRGVYGDDFVLGGALELARDLQSRTEEEPERFARLVLTLPDDINPIYVGHVVMGLRRAELDANLTVAVARRAHTMAGSTCGRWLPDLFAERPDVVWSNEALGLVAWYAVNDPDPSEDLWLRGINGHDPFSAGINSARGMAALAMGRLLFNHPERLGVFREALERVVEDPIVAVRACVAVAPLALLDRHPELALSLFLRLVDARDELLVSPHVERFLHYGLRRRFDALRPVLERLMNSALPEATQTGGRLACLIALDDPGAADLAGRALTGTTAQRLGAAQVYAANAHDDRVGATCRAALVKLFHDDDEAVRKEAGRCFRTEDDDPAEWNVELIDAYIRSPALHDEPFFLLHGLEQSSARIPATVLDVAEAYIAHAPEDVTDLRTRRAADTHTVSELVVRVYGQALNRPRPDAVLLARCLDMFDQLAEWREYRYMQMLETYER